MGNPAYHYQIGPCYRYWVGSGLAGEAPGTWSLRITHDANQVASRADIRRMLAIPECPGPIIPVTVRKPWVELETDSREDL